MLRKAENHLAFEARGYDSRIGRFLGVDPFARKFPTESNYTFGGDNPILFIDQKGELKLIYYSDAQLRDLGLTRAQLIRFEQNINNLSKIVVDNPAVLSAIANTTGLSNAEILRDLSANHGPFVRVGKIAFGYPAEGNLRNGVTVDPNMVKYLASIDPNDKAKLATQTFAIALTLIHEYGHIGDQKTNDGYNTAQYLTEKVEYPNGSRTSRVQYSTIFPQSNVIKDRGVQSLHTTLTGHRGTDIEVMGFGVEVEFDEKNEKGIIKKGDVSPTTIEEYREMVPEVSLQILITHKY